MMSATTLKNFSFFRLLNNIPLPYLYAFSDKVDEENEECCYQDVEERGEKEFNHQERRIEKLNQCVPVFPHGYISLE